MAINPNYSESYQAYRCVKSFCNFQNESVVPSANKLKVISNRLLFLMSLQKRDQWTFSEFFHKTQLSLMQINHIKNTLNIFFIYYSGKHQKRKDFAEEMIKYINTLSIHNQDIDQNIEARDLVYRLVRLEDMKLPKEKKMIRVSNVLHELVLFQSDYNRSVGQIFSRVCGGKYLVCLDDYKKMQKLLEQFIRYSDLKTKNYKGRLRLAKMIQIHLLMRITTLKANQKLSREQMYVSYQQYKQVHEDKSLIEETW